MVLVPFHETVAAAIHPNRSIGFRVEARQSAIQTARRADPVVAAFSSSRAESHLEQKSTSMAIPLTSAFSGNSIDREERAPCDETQNQPSADARQLLGLLLRRCNQ
jgi:hypothetical protein